MFNRQDADSKELGEPRFDKDSQADAHVKRWVIEDWFWNRFYADLLDDAMPPAEWLR